MSVDVEGSSHSPGRINGDRFERNPFEFDAYFTQSFEPRGWRIEEDMRKEQLQRLRATLYDVAGHEIARGTVEVRPLGVWERFTVMQHANAASAPVVWAGTREPITGQWWVVVDGGNVSGAALACSWPGHEPPGLLRSRRPPPEVALVVEASVGHQGWDILLCPVRQRVEVSWEDAQGARVLGETYRFAVVRMARRRPGPELLSKPVAGE